jgi:hypothetical protein
MKSNSSLRFATLLLWTCCFGISQAQNLEDRPLSTYEKVLEILFPQQRNAPDDVFVLRVIAAPRDQPEFAITLRQSRTQSSVSIARASEMVSTLVNQDDEHGPKNSPSSIAGKVRVQRESGVIATTQLFEWQKQFWLELQRSAEVWQRESIVQTRTGVADISLDGGTVYIVYEQGLNVLRLRADDNDRMGLGHWLKEVRDLAERQISSAKGAAR